MASSTRPMSNCVPMVLFTPISTLSKSIKTAMPVLRGSADVADVMFMNSRSSAGEWLHSPEGWRVAGETALPSIRGLLRQLRRLEFCRDYPSELPALQQLAALPAATRHLILAGTD